MDVNAVESHVDVCAAEKLAFSTVWSNIEHLLSGDRECAEAFVRALAVTLPHPAAFTSPELHELSRMHLGSSQNLMKTMRQLAPAAFKDSSTAHPDPSVLDHLEGVVLSMVSVLIELQLFHLQRAAALTAHHRQRLALQATVHYGCVSDSSSDGDTSSDQQRIQ